MKNNHVAGTIKDGRKIISEETRERKAAAGRKAALKASGRYEKQMAEIFGKREAELAARIELVVANAQSGGGCDLFAERWISRKGYRLA